MSDPFPMFDVFLSFRADEANRKESEASGSGRAFAERLSATLSKLEIGGLISGDQGLENVSFSPVNGSRATICLVDDAYLQSEWCVAELRQAQKMDRAIILDLRETPSQNTENTIHAAGFDPSSLESILKHEAGQHLIRRLSLLLHRPGLPELAEEMAVPGRINHPDEWMSRHPDDPFTLKHGQKAEAEIRSETSPSAYGAPPLNIVMVLVSPSSSYNHQEMSRAADLNARLALLGDAVTVSDLRSYDELSWTFPDNTAVLLFTSRSRRNIPRFASFMEEARRQAVAVHVVTLQKVARPQSYGDAASHDLGTWDGRWLHSGLAGLLDALTRHETNKNLRNPVVGQLNVAFRELRDGVDRHVRDMPEAASTYEALSAQLRQSIDAENEFTATAGEGVADISRWASILLRFAPQFEELLNLSGPAPGKAERQAGRSTSAPDHVEQTRSDGHGLPAWLQSTLPVLPALGLGILTALLVSWCFDLPLWWTDRWADLFLSRRVPDARIFGVDIVWPLAVILLPAIAALTSLFAAPVGWRAAWCGLFGTFATLFAITALRSSIAPATSVPLWALIGIALLLIAAYFVTLRMRAQTEGADTATLWSRAKPGWVAIALGIPLALGVATHRDVHGTVQTIAQTQNGSAVSALASGLNSRGERMVAIADYDGQLMLVNLDARRLPVARHDYGDDKPVTQLLWMPNPLRDQNDAVSGLLGAASDERVLAAWDIAREGAGLSDSNEIDAAALRTLLEMFEGHFERQDPCVDQGDDPCPQLVGPEGPMRGDLAIIYAENLDAGESAETNPAGFPKPRGITLLAWLEASAPSISSKPLDPDDVFLEGNRRQIALAAPSRTVQAGVIAVRDGAVSWWDGLTGSAPVEIWTGTGTPLVSVASDGTVSILGQRAEAPAPVQQQFQPGSAGGEPATEDSEADAISLTRHSIAVGRDLNYQRLEPLPSIQPGQMSAIASVVLPGTAETLAIFGKSDGSLLHFDTIESEAPALGSAIVKLDILTQANMESPGQRAIIVSHHRNGSSARWAFDRMPDSVRGEVRHLRSYPREFAHQAYPESWRWTRGGSDGRVSVKLGNEASESPETLAEVSGFADVPAEIVELPDGKVLAGSWDGTVVLADVRASQRLARLDPGENIRRLGSMVGTLGTWFARWNPAAEPVDPTRSLAAMRDLDPRDRAYGVSGSAGTVLQTSRFAVGSVIARPKDAGADGGLLNDEIATQEQTGSGPQTRELLARRSLLAKAQQASQNAVFDSLSARGLSAEIAFSRNGTMNINTEIYDVVGNDTHFAVSTDPGCEQPENLDQIRANPALATECMIADLRASGDFEYVEKDWIFTIQENPPATDLPEQAQTPVTDIERRIVPIDLPTDASEGRKRAKSSPLLPLQWNLAGDRDGSARFDTAWSNTTGDQDVVVALIDTGIDATHPELRDTVLVQGWDFVSDPMMSNDGDGRDGDPTDSGDICYDSVPGEINSYHGTETAALIAGGTTVGIMSAAPRVSLLPVRAIGRCGGRLSDITDAMRWAAGLIPAEDRDGAEVWVTSPADIINLPIGLFEYCPASLQDAIDDITSSGVVIVTAAGNFRAPTTYLAPAGCNGVVTVAASDGRGYLTSYSSYGADVDLMAPGGDLERDDDGDRVPDGLLVPGRMTNCVDPVTFRKVSDCTHALVDGTSYSAAHVSAALALLMSQAPDARGTVAIDTLMTHWTRSVSDQMCSGACEAYPGAEPISGTDNLCYRPCGRALDLGQPPSPASSASNISAETGTLSFRDYILTLPIAHETPSTAVYNQTFEAMLAIDATQLADGTAAGSSFAGQEIAEDAARLEVRLTGSAFKIVSVSSGIQLLSPQTENIWRWSVTPKEPGNHDLVFEVFEVQRDSVLPLRTFSNNVEVQVTGLSRPLAFAQRTNPLIILAIAIGMLLAALFSAIWVFRRRRARG